MSALRRVALGFPLAWSHRRGYSFSSLERPGEGRYFIEWDPGSGVYGEDFTDAPRDARGVLLSGPSRSYHPIRIAQFALHRFGVWHDTSDASARKDVLDQAAWLRDRQEDGARAGLYRFEFPWTKYGAGTGWSSAMAQGEAISVLLRAHRLDRHAGYADAAVRAGAFGARMTGGGFGGCVIALVPIDRVEVVGEAVRRAVCDAGFGRPVITRTRASAGAGLCG